MAKKIRHDDAAESPQGQALIELTEPAPNEYEPLHQRDNRFYGIKQQINTESTFPHLISLSWQSLPSSFQPARR